MFGEDQLILLLEADEGVRRFASAALDYLGYRVIEVYSAQEALNHVESDSETEVLVTNVRLPDELDGWELARRAVEIKPTLKVLIATGYSPPPTRGPPFLRNVSVLPKPYRLLDLANALKELLARSV